MFKLHFFLSLLCFTAFAELHFMNFGEIYNNTCVITPSQHMCMSYNLPETVVQADIIDLCSEMPFMCGCTVDKLCEDSHLAMSPYCKPFSVLKDLCLDMPRMSGCGNYNSMCSNVSVVQECQTSALPLPSTMQTQSMIVSICTEMNMEGCNECTSAISSCDLLTTYSNLCKAMPDMSQCAKWKTMCQAVPDWGLCSTSTPDSPPQMRMYFHTGFADYVLFKGWVPRTAGEYAGTFIACTVMGIIGEIIKWFRSRCERVWKKQEAEKGKKFYQPDLFIDVPRALLRFFEIGWGLLVMLVAMTFNVGLFLSVCLGAAIGTFFFGRYTDLSSTSACCE